MILDVLASKVCLGNTALPPKWPDGCALRIVFAPLRLCGKVRPSDSSPFVENISMAARRGTNFPARQQTCKEQPPPHMGRQSRFTIDDNFEAGNQIPR
jgi:hypothetical protein